MLDGGFPFQQIKIQGFLRLQRWDKPIEGFRPNRKILRRYRPHLRLGGHLEYSIEEPWEKASELSAVRNGYRECRLSTCVGTVTLKIPKLREGTYSPDDIVER